MRRAFRGSVLRVRIYDHPLNGRSSKRHEVEILALSQATGENTENPKPFQWKRLLCSCAVHPRSRRGASGKWYAWNQAPPVQEDHSLAGAIAGGVAGGLLGSLMGEGTGKVAAAAVSAGLGAIAGDRLSRNHTTSAGETHTTVTPVQRCKMVDHYDVRTH